MSQKHGCTATRLRKTGVQPDSLHEGLESVSHIVGPLFRLEDAGGFFQRIARTLLRRLGVILEAETASDVQRLRYSREALDLGMPKNSSDLAVEALRPTASDRSFTPTMLTVTRTRSPDLDTHPYPTARCPVLGRLSGVPGFVLVAKMRRCAR